MDKFPRMSDDVKRYLPVVCDSVVELHKAVLEMKDAVVRSCDPLPPRPKVFEITANAVWPLILSGDVYYSCMGIKEWPVAVHDHATAACDLLRLARTPRDVIRVVRQLERATAWCRARAEGYRRVSESMVEWRREKS